MIERPDEKGPAWRRRSPWGFLGMIGLVAAIEWTLSGHDLDFTTPMQWDWRVIGKAATRPDRVSGKDVLIFGDSLAKFGVQPRALKRRSGTVAYNFALHTGQTSSSYFMLRRALHAGARPSAVILELTPHMLASGPEVNNPLWAELLWPDECLDMSRVMRAPDFLASTMLASVLATYKERHEIRASIMAAIRGTSTSRREEIPRYRRNWKLNEGAQLFAESPLPAIDVDHWNTTLYGRWAPHPVNVAYLDRFLALARSRNIAVYWLLPPIHPAVQELTEESGYDEEYTRFVRETQARFPGTVVLDARQSGFSADDFYDGVHVERRGAMRLSIALADLLADRPDGGTGGRWVSLETGEAGGLDMPLEDVIQSALAIQALEAQTRR
jgi:hypothetical protein